MLIPRFEVKEWPIVLPIVLLGVHRSPVALAPIRMAPSLPRHRTSATIADLPVDRPVSLPTTKTSPDAYTLTVYFSVDKVALATHADCITPVKVEV